MRKEFQKAVQTAVAARAAAPPPVADADFQNTSAVKLPLVPTVPAFPDGETSMRHDGNDHQTVSALSQIKKIPPQIKNILEKSFLVTSLTFALAVGYTAYELTNKDKTGNTTEIMGSDILSAMANFFLAATFGKNFLNYITTLPEKNRAYLLASVIAFSPSLLTVLAAYKLNVDSLSGLGFSDTAKGFLEGPNLFYNATTRFLSLVDMLYKRFYCNAIHLWNRYLSADKATYAVYYALRDSLVIHKHALHVSSDKNELNALVHAIVQQAIADQISFGRTRSQWALTVTKHAVSVAAVSTVFYVVPVLFSMLTAAGLSALSQVEFFQKSMGWIAPKNGPWGDSTALVLIGMLPTLALYITSALDAPNNMEDLVRTFWSGFKKVIASAPAGLVLSLLVSGGLTGLVTLTGRGLAGEMAKTLVVSPMINGTNTTLPSPYVNFGTVANDIFFNNFVFMLFFNFMQKILVPTVAAMLAAGTLANGRGLALWILGCISKMGNTRSPVIEFLKGMLSYNLGVYNPQTDANQIGVKGFIEKLDAALVTGALEAGQSDLEANDCADNALRVGDARLLTSAVQEDLQAWQNNRVAAPENSGCWWDISDLWARLRRRPNVLPSRDTLDDPLMNGAPPANIQ